MNILCLLKKNIDRDSYLQSFIENKKINFFVHNIHERKEKIKRIIDDNNIKFILIINYFDINIIYNLKINEVYPNMKFIFFHHGLTPRHHNILDYQFTKFKLYSFQPNYIKLRYPNHKKYLFPIYGDTTIDLLRNKIQNKNLIKLDGSIDKNCKSLLYIDRPEIDMKYFYYIFNYCYKNNYNIFICMHQKKKNSERNNISKKKIYILNYLYKININVLNNKDLEIFVENKFYIIPNKYLYDYIAFSDLIFCPTRTSVSIQLLNTNKKYIIFLTKNDLKNIEDKKKEYNRDDGEWINNWIKNPNLNDFDTYYFHQFNYNVLSIDKFKNLSDIIDNKDILDFYTNNKKSKLDLLKFIYGNKYKIENTTDRIINRLYKL